MKKFFKLLCLAACVFSITACSSNTKEDSSKIFYNESDYTATIEDNLKFLSDTSDSELKQLVEVNEGYYSDELVDWINSWINTRPEVGEYIGVLEYDFDADSDRVTVVAKVDYTLRDANFKISFLKDGSLDYTTYDVQYTLGEKMGKAALNTVIGISVVFVVLILISLLIGCFKYINMAETAIKNRKAAKSADSEAAVDNAIAQIVQKEEGELVDNLELVAVISAAVAAYTGTSTDGFVVRSIKKSNKKRWMNA